MTVTRISDFLIREGKTRLLACPKCRGTAFTLHSILRKGKPVIIRIVCTTEACRNRFEVVESSILSR